MSYQNVFKRYEIKYLITLEQKALIQNAMSDYMISDAYGKSTVKNIYYDTPDFLLARRSVEKPFYKEKLRLRGYGDIKDDSNVFVELKKKYDSVVYKRRVSMSESEALAYLKGAHVKDSQIISEIDYFFSQYKPIPAAFISYEREAFYSKEDSGFRVTFDRNILWRDSDLSLCAEVGGYPLLEKNQALMEVKTTSAIPLWFVALLSKNRIYKTSFSKYGNAYRTMLLQSGKGGFYA